MKTTILMAFLTMSITAQAASVGTFKTTSRCETAQKVKGSEMIIEIQEAQNKRTQLVISPSGQQSWTIPVKTILPPKMMAGAPVKYIGKDTGTNNDIILAVSPTRIVVGKVVGRSAKLTVENLFENLAMICVYK